MFTSEKETENVLLSASLRKLPPRTFSHSTVFVERLLYARYCKERGQLGKLSVGWTENKELKTGTSRDREWSGTCYLSDMSGQGRLLWRHEVWAGDSNPKESRKGLEVAIPCRTAASTVLRGGLRFPADRRGGQCGCSSGRSEGTTRWGHLGDKSQIGTAL